MCASRSITEYNRNAQFQHRKHNFYENSGNAIARPIEAATLADHLSVSLTAAYNISNLQSSLEYSGRGGDVILNYPAPVDLDLFDCRRELTSILLVGTINNRVPIADLKFMAWYCSRHDIKLVIAGSIQSEFRELEENSSVVLLPYKKGEEYAELLAQSSLGFAAYVKEGKNYELCAPVKVYDYLFSGMPLLTSDHVTLKSMAEESPGMLTYVLGDFESLHQQLEEYRLNWPQYSKQAFEGAVVFQDRERLFGQSLRSILELD